MESFDDLLGRIGTNVERQIAHDFDADPDSFCDPLCDTAVADLISNVTPPAGVADPTVVPTASTTSAACEASMVGSSYRSSTATESQINAALLPPTAASDKGGGSRRGSGVQTQTQTHCSAPGTTADGADATGDPTTLPETLIRIRLQHRVLVAHERAWRGVLDLAKRKLRDFVLASARTALMTRPDAASIIQRAYRHHRGRCVAVMEIFKRVRAIKTMQRFARGYLGRRVARRERENESEMQRLMRLLTLTESRAYNRVNTAASVGAPTLLPEIDPDDTVTVNAVIKMQSVVRCALARRRYLTLRRVGRDISSRLAARVWKNFIEAHGDETKEQRVSWPFIFGYFCHARFDSCQRRKTHGLYSTRARLHKCALFGPLCLLCALSYIVLLSRRSAPFSLGFLSARACQTC